MRFTTFALLCLLWPFAALAQDDQDEDRGFLAGLLENALGGEGRTVRITGFQGALSSTARIAQITIADADGVWLTLADVEMGWNRSALFRGVVDISELKAARIDLPRLPLPAEGTAPAPEAAPFALPDLPAEITIETLAIDSVSLGAPVLGEAAAFSLSGAASLADGAGEATLQARRIDGPQAQFDVFARYANETRALTLDIALNEAEGGLISGLIGVPDQPSLSLTLTGDGALSDFAAELDLRTDDTPRLTGTLALQNELDGPMAFEVDMDGDVSALFLPEYRDFFGPDVTLTARGDQDGDGVLTLETFALDTRALRLAGTAAIGADGWPTLLDIEGEIADPSGAPVLLPAGGDATRIDAARLQVAYDVADGDALSAQIDIDGLDRADVRADTLALTLDGTMQGNVGDGGTFDSRVDLVAQGLALADAALARAVGTEVRGGLNIAYVGGDPLRLRDLDLTGAAWALRGNATIDSFTEAFSTDFDVTVAADDLSVFADLAGLDLQGAGTLAAQGNAALGGFFDVTVTGDTRGLAVGIAQADALLAGPTTLDLRTRRDDTGTYLDRFRLANDAVAAEAEATLQTGASQATFDLTLDDAGRVSTAISGPLQVNGTAAQTGDVWDVVAALSGPLAARADVTAAVAPERIDIDLTAAIPDLSPLVPQLDGGANLTATAVQRDGVWTFDTDLRGPADATAAIDGRFDGMLSADYDIAVPDVAPFAPGVSGPAALDGTVRQLASGWAFSTEVRGPYAASGTLSGTYGDAGLRTAFELGVPDVSPVVPGVSGPLALDGTLQQDGSRWTVATDVRGPYASSGTISGVYGPDTLTARYDLRLPNVGALVAGVNGAARVNGTATQVPRGFDIDADLTGPSGTSARVAGLIGSDGQLALDANGQAQLGLANPFLEPRNIAGVATFDLTVDGPPALSSVSGQITTQGTRLAAPNLPLSFNNISGAVRLAQGRATLDLDAGVTEGGVIALRGPITLSGRYPAQIDVTLNSVVVADPTLYTTTVNGGITLRGALLGGARIAGNIDVGETNVQVPSSGISSFGPIPAIDHVGATRPVLRTRDRAGLAARDDGAGGGGPAYPLDITVNAPGRIFIRGRGLDAEVGGSLRLTGTTADIISTGQFDLIRGRLNILTKRFDLDEGRVQLQGRFEPFLRFVATTPTATGTARIVIEGPADDPEVTFESTPETPEDQVLAQIFFGRDISQLSAFQAVQLANAVAQLAGRGGEGIVSRLRGSFDLDDLDVTTDSEGNAAVRAGKYLSENVYTDVTVGGKDGPEVSLNIDLTPNITVRGSVGADSNTGVGIFIEKDY